MGTFWAAIWPAFFIRVSPASRNANPACMNMTRTAATTTQTVLAAMRRAGFFIALPPRAPAGWFVGAVPGGNRPDEPVPGLVPTPRRVDDRIDAAICERVVDDER